MDYRLFYDLVVEEEHWLRSGEVADCYDLIGGDLADNYRLCKALAACYELHEYLANRIAETEQYEESAL